MIMNNTYLITILYPSFFNFILFKKLKNHIKNIIKIFRFFLIRYILDFLKRV